jgi:hypothetical protein
MATGLQPICLGKSANHKKDIWYFFAKRDGFARIIRYVDYPYWCALDEICVEFDLSIEPSHEINNAVEKFLIERQNVPSLPGCEERIDSKTVEGNRDGSGEPTSDRRDRHTERNLHGSGEPTGTAVEEDARKSSPAAKRRGVLRATLSGDPDKETKPVEVAVFQSSFNRFITDNLNALNGARVTKEVSVKDVSPEGPANGPTEATARVVVKKPRGRPPGSKNKVKSVAEKPSPKRSSR